MTQDHLPDQHWKDFDMVERELLLSRWIEQHGTSGTMPTDAQLKVSRRSDVAQVIRNYHRGYNAVTAALGLKPHSNPPFVKPGTYWREWVNVVAEMPAVSEACGVSEKMPTQQQPLANGYTSLNNAIREHYSLCHKFQQRLDR